MMLRTPAIRRDRPRIRGSPALPARSTSAGLVPAELSAKNHRCDAKDHARPRKYLEQNTFSKRGVQVQLGRSYPREDPSCSGLVPTAKTTLNPAHVRPERRALHNEPRLDDTIRHDRESYRRCELIVG